MPRRHGKKANAAAKVSPSLLTDQNAAKTSPAPLHDSSSDTPSLQSHAHSSLASSVAGTTAALLGPEMSDDDSIGDSDYLPLSEEEDSPVVTASDYEDDSEAEVDESAEESSDYEPPSQEEAETDPLFRTQVEYLFNCAMKTLDKTNIHLAADGIEDLKMFVYCHLWLPQMGYADEDVLTPGTVVPLFSN